MSPGLDKARKSVSLKVLAAYARDMGRGVVRVDHASMDALAVSTGDTVEVVGKRDVTEALCYPLLPSDEGKGITRIDPKIRQAIGADLEDTVEITTAGQVAAEVFAPRQEPGEEGATPVMAMFSGSCIGFDKEYSKIMEFVGTLEFAVRSKSQCRCYADGKKTMGWDFFNLEMDMGFIEKLVEVYPDINRQEGNTFEERLALWMNKQLKKTKLEYNLKLKDIPQEKVKGFRLDPESFRTDRDLDDLR
jgi:hypothetical protein